jgi:putative hydrolase of the HAD superfamily
VARIEWIFFDCFNTLVDDFDEHGDESGLGPIAELPVEAGLFASAEEFRRAYLEWRSERLSGGDFREVPLGERLRSVLRERGHGDRARADALARRMVDAFERDYPRGLRETPGVRDMLRAWSGKARMAVVSNFFLPGWPERVLRSFDLVAPFEFVLDSASFGVRKPGPAIFLEALRRAGLANGPRERALFVGDHRRNDVEAPRRLGLRALHLARRRDLPERDAWSWFRP